jgi:tetratricopeptide (TPR) repeat protein
MKHAAVRIGIVLVCALLSCAGAEAQAKMVGELPENPALREAVLRFEAGDDEVAESFFRSRLADRPDDATASYYLGRIHFRRQQPDEAIDMFSRAIGQQPDNPTYHLWLGRAYLRKLQRASVFSKLGLSKQVREEYRTAIELDPDNIDARKSLAGYLLEAPGIAGGNEEDAMEQVAEIRRRDPVAAHYFLGEYYFGEEEYQRARKEFQAALELAPESPDTHYWLGLLHQQQEAYMEAFTAFETALRFDSEDWKSLYQVGRTASLSGEKLERGAEALRSYLESDPGPELPSPAWAHYRLGLILQRSGDTVGARRSFETALSLDPEHEEAKKSLKKLR